MCGLEDVIRIRITRVTPGQGSSEISVDEESSGAHTIPVKATKAIIVIPLDNVRYLDIHVRAFSPKASEQG